MARPQMRPSFRIKATCTAERLQQAIAHNLDLANGEVEGDLSSRHGVLRVPAEKRRFWTPCLDLTVEDQVDEVQASEGTEADARLAEPSHSEVWGTFAPRAEIWTAFVFAIGTLTVISIFAAVYGIAQLALGHAPFALLLPFGAALLAALLYLAALVGQGLSISDMYRLRAFLDDCMREAEADSLNRKPLPPRDAAQL